MSSITSPSSDVNVNSRRTCSAATSTVASDPVTEKGAESSAVASIFTRYCSGVDACGLAPSPLAHAPNTNNSTTAPSQRAANCTSNPSPAGSGCASSRSLLLVDGFGELVLGHLGAALDVLLLGLLVELILRHARRVRLARSAGGAGFPVLGLLELLPKRGELVVAERLAQLGEQLFLFLARVVLDVLDEDRHLGGPGLVGWFELLDLLHEHIDEVVLLDALVHELLGLLADVLGGRVEDFLLDGGVHLKLGEDLLFELRHRGGVTGLLRGLELLEQVADLVVIAAQQLQGVHVASMVGRSRRWSIGEGVAGRPQRPVVAPALCPSARDLTGSE